MDQSEARSSAWEELPEGAFVAEPNGTLAVVNRAWRASLGPADDKKLWDALGGDVGEEVQRAWQNHGGELDVTAQLDGDRWLQVVAHPTSDGCVVGVVRDVSAATRRSITQQRIALWSKRLHQADSFDELLSLAEQAVTRWTRYRNASLFVLPDATSRFARLLATSGRQTELKWEHVPTIDVDQDELARALLASDGPLVVEDARVDPRTDKRIVSALGNRTIINVPLVLLDERLGAFSTGTYDDEGVCVPTEEELEHLEAMAVQIAVAAGRLRLLERQRASDQERQRLEREVLRAEKLESLGLLAGGIAHDVNNLMTAVIGNVARAAPAVAAGPARDALEQARLAATRTGGLAKQLLAYAGHGVVVAETGDLTALAQEMVALARGASSTDIEFTGEDALVVRGDLTQLRQLVMNVIANAAEALDEERGTVRVAVRRSRLDDAALATSLTSGATADLDVALLTVEDDGCGMDAATRERLFDPFFTTKGGGRGLGMSAVLGIVQAHEGAIWIESEVGEGTRFTVALPVHDGPARTPTAPPPASRAVLIVEDHAMLRRLACSFLEEAGFATLEACDGIEAQEVFEEHRDLIGAVVLDSRMPRMGGAAVLAWLEETAPDVGVVLTSGHTQDRAGKAAAFLPKPYEPEALVETVKRLLEP